MTTTSETSALRCYLCEKPCDGSLRDEFGEWVMGFDKLPVCEGCDEHLENEPFDHKDWS